MMKEETALETGHLVDMNLIYIPRELRKSSWMRTLHGGSSLVETRLMMVLVRSCGVASRFDSF
jgi:hypothetical protein